MSRPTLNYFEQHVKMYQRYNKFREGLTVQGNGTGDENSRSSQVVHHWETGVDSTGVEFIVRRATFQDYQSVMDINRNVYEGFDYLQDMYFMFLHENRTRLYLVEQNGKVVSFAIYSPSLDSTHLTAMALRTHPDFQGRGLSANKNKILKKLVKRDFPNATHEMHTRMAYELKTENEILHVWNCNGYAVKVPDIVKILNALPNASVKQSDSPAARHSLTQLSYINCMKLLTSGESFETFFNKMNFKYFPLTTLAKPTKISKENLKILFGISHLYVGFDTSLENTAITSTNSNESRIVSLSYRYVYLMKKKPNVDMYYFGSAENLRDHFAVQLRDICQICEDEMMVALNVPRSITFSMMEELVKDLGLIPESVDPFANRLILYMMRKPF